MKNGLRNLFHENIFIPEGDIQGVHKLIFPVWGLLLLKRMSFELKPNFALRLYSFVLSNVKVP